MTVQEESPLQKYLVDAIILFGFTLMLMGLDIWFTVNIVVGAGMARSLYLLTQSYFWDYPFLKGILTLVLVFIFASNTGTF